MPDLHDHGQPIGTVTHYFNHLSVAAVRLTGQLHLGDRIHIAGGERDLEQTVDSMEVDHAKVTTAGPGDDVALKVDGRVHEHDRIYRAD